MYGLFSLAWPDLCTQIRKPVCVFVYTMTVVRTTYNLVQPIMWLSLQKDNSNE